MHTHMDARTRGSKHARTLTRACMGGAALGATAPALGVRACMCMHVCMPHRSSARGYPLHACTMHVHAPHTRTWQLTSPAREKAEHEAHSAARSCALLMEKMTPRRASGRSRMCVCKASGVGGSIVVVLGVCAGERVYLCCWEDAGLCISSSALIPLVRGNLSFRAPRGKRPL